MERNQAEQVRNNLVAKFKEVGIECSWLMESGGITMKRSGEVKVSFSLRNEATFKSDVVKMKEIVSQSLTNSKVTISNQFSSSRPEGKVIVTINQ
ncbi:hypothetical protein D3C80_1037560 [compost metagenome]